MAVLCVTLSAACYSDYREHRIPNWLTGIIFLYGMLFRYWDAGGAGIINFLQNCLTLLLIMYPLFKIGMVGAGDVKLFTTVSGYLSGYVLIWFLFYSLLIAAVISILKICKERSVKERFRYLCAYLADVCHTGQWRLYPVDRDGAKRTGICLAGPVLASVLLHLGGIY